MREATPLYLRAHDECRVGFLGLALGADVSESQREADTGSRRAAAAGHAAR